METIPRYWPFVREIRRSAVKSPASDAELCVFFDLRLNKRFSKQSWGWWFDIRTLHDCPSQMNENLLISNSKLTSDSELIWWR